MPVSLIASNSTLGQTNQTLQQDLQNLGTALQSGSLSSAQQSFAQLLQDKQNLNQAQGTTQSQGHHHHHHHHATGNQQANASQTSQTSSSQGTVQNILTSALTGVSQSQGSTMTTS